jgi:hypothetical protein
MFPNSPSSAITGAGFHETVPVPSLAAVKGKAREKIYYKDDGISRFMTSSRI